MLRSPLRAAVAVAVWSGAAASAITLYRWFLPFSAHPRLLLHALRVSVHVSAMRCWRWLRASPPSPGDGARAAAAAGAVPPPRGWGLAMETCLRVAKELAPRVPRPAEQLDDFRAFLTRVGRLVCARGGEGGPLRMRMRAGRC